MLGDEVSSITAGGRGEGNGKMYSRNPYAAKLRIYDFARKFDAIYRTNYATKLIKISPEITFCYSFKLARGGPVLSFIERNYRIKLFVYRRMNKRTVTQRFIVYVWFSIKFATATTTGNVFSKHIGQLFYSVSE